MVEEYRVPASETVITIDVRNSRFVAIVRGCESVETARANIADIKRQHSNATHHVYAFRIGFGNTVQEGLSDDGEPAGTAGQPVMSVLRGSDLGDVLIVVVRYFGGTKLGTGGLVRAYSESAATAIKACPTFLKTPMAQANIILSYSQYERAKRTLIEFEATVDHMEFLHDVELQVTVPARNFDALQAAMRESTGGTAQFHTL